MTSSRRKRRTFVLNSTLIVFVEYSFSHVPLPYNKFHVSLKGCSQIIEIGTFINGWTFEVGAKMCAVADNLNSVIAGNLTLLHTQTGYTLKPWHRYEPTTSRCDGSGTVPEPFRLALWCERSTGPVPERVQSARSLRVHVCLRARARA